MEASVERKLSWTEKLINWRNQYVSDKQFTLILAFFIGLFASVAAFVLHWIIREIQLLLTAGFNITSANWLYLVFPVIGIFLTSVFVRR
ncbi:MAG: chloride channel protein, partial [Prevotella sp.]|nr:chloride channel protein [Prevotella sp.]